jgi:predicted SPOUT superfamily RNA methylase MTH1
MYKTKDCKHDKCTVVFVNGKNGAVEVLNKKSVYQTVLFNFFVQQQAQEFAKEEAVIGAAVVGAEAATELDNDMFDLF